MSKHDIITEFFKPKAEELAGDILHFNYSPEDISISMITDYSEKVLNSYVTGRKRKAYGFSFIIVKAYSTSDDDLNLEAMNYAQALMDWVEGLNREENYPDLGEKTEVEQIEVLQNMPNLSGVNAKEGLARYMMQFRLIYVDDTEKRF